MSKAKFKSGDLVENIHTEEIEMIKIVVQSHSYPNLQCGYFINF